jgi:hypothetical protein
MHKGLLLRRWDAILTAQPDHLRALLTGQKIGPLATIRRVLALPVTQRLLCATQLRRQLPGCARSRPQQPHRL